MLADVSGRTETLATEAVENKNLLILFAVVREAKFPRKDLLEIAPKLVRAPGSQCDLEDAP